MNATFKMNRVVCEDNAEDAACMPLTPTSENDHYFYFDNVGESLDRLLRTQADP